MAARNERERLLTKALNNLAQVMANQGGGGEATMYHGLDRFQRNNPPTFKGGYDPKGAKAWLREIEKIFHVTECQTSKRCCLLLTCWQMRQSTGGRTLAHI